jgi:hypothetical protein
MSWDKSNITDKTVSPLNLVTLATFEIFRGIPVALITIKITKDI